MFQHLPKICLEIWACPNLMWNQLAPPQDDFCDNQSLLEQAGGEEDTGNQLNTEDDFNAHMDDGLSGQIDDE